MAMAGYVDRCAFARGFRPPVWSTPDNASVVQSEIFPTASAGRPTRSSHHEFDLRKIARQ